MTTKDIAGIAVGVAATSLAVGAVKDMQKALKGKPIKNTLKSTTKLITGTALLGASSDIVNKL